LLRDCTPRCLRTIGVTIKPLLTQSG
jgi:hypothetical protein